MTRRITTVAELEALYGSPVKTSLIKEIDYISDHYRAFIDAAPFVVLATSGAGGLDCTPRGDPPGFVRVVDNKTLLIPDRRGNNRIDTLRNLVEDPRISLLFLIPGIGNTLRINGTAEIIVDEDLSTSFAVNGKVPATLLRITAEQVYFQCPKALVRSKLWQDDFRQERSALPSTGEILKALSDDFDGEAYDRNYPDRLEETIY